MSDGVKPVSGRAFRAWFVSRTSVTAARSVTGLAMVPAASNALETDQIPSMCTLSVVGFKAYRAARPAGWRREPSVSVPKDAGLNPAETPTADPVEDPHGL